MLVRELIAKLQAYKPDAEVSIWASDHTGDPYEDVCEVIQLVGVWGQDRLPYTGTPDKQDVYLEVRTDLGLK